MARTDTLGHFLTDVADSIREKKGAQETITASDFDTEIENLPSGGDISDYFLEEVSIYQQPLSIIKKIPIVDLQNRTSAFSFSNYISLEEVEGFLNSDKMTSMNMMFDQCASLQTVALFDTSSASDWTTAFGSCEKLKTIPNFNTSSATNFDRTFSQCAALENVPVFNWSKVNANNCFRNTFYSCKKLTDTSLDNILQSCISATLYNGTKTLKTLGINDTNVYPTSRIQALPHYQDFVDAGWSIGY
jgi:surface protein